MTMPEFPSRWQAGDRPVTAGYSLEITARDVPALREAAPRIPAGTSISVTFLAGENVEDRIAAAAAVRELGFEPMPHFSARCIASHAEFEDYLTRVVAAAGVRRCFVVAGDPAEPAGPFADSSSLIATGAFERAGITHIGIGGHPDGHPVMDEEQRWEVLAGKCDSIRARGMSPLIVTQFGFDADAMLAWLRELRARGIAAPVRLGVPGPAGIKTLIRFAAHCGVGASASVLAKYGISIRKLIGSAGPDRMVDTLAAGIAAQDGEVALHFYPFGGLSRCIDWIDGHAALASGSAASASARGRLA